VSDQLDVFRRTFFEECADLLTQAEQQLASLSEAPTDAEAMAAIFRAVHSIKGGAGAFGFDRLVAFAHVFESTLDTLRSDPELAAARLDRAGHGLLMRSFDMLADLVSEARGDSPLPHGHEAAILQSLTAWVGGTAAAHEGPLPASGAAKALPGGKQRFRLHFAPSAEMMRQGNEPLLLLRELHSLGQMEVTADLTRLPDFELMEPDIAYLAWDADIETEADDARLAEVFEFVADDSVIRIEAIAAVGPEVVADAVVSEVAHAPATEAAPAATAGLTGSIRVNLEKVDRLVNMVGEIVITHAMITQQISGQHLIRHPELIRELDQMAHHVRELQENVMSIRAQPVRSVFARLPRLVRELALGLGRDVRVVTIGESTEVDKTVIEQLSDPLTHLVRNAVDHGIEPPEQRVAAGKPREGTITLSASHRSGRVVLEIADDGRGIDRARVQARCIERGLVAADAVLSDDDIDNFIFMPGFSTAEKVSNISGRGVGMDVVKRNIQALGGRIHLASTPGRGSRITLSLPLTLAVLDGMIVTAGGERYIVPLTNILESIRPRPGDVLRLGPDHEVLAIRGEYVRLVHLASVLRTGPPAQDDSTSLVVLVELEGGDKLGLRVDELLGQQQVVIKSLESNYARIEGISAATILGDGRVALILDVAALRQIRIPLAA
jgi:two-component system chemotaxis sensor kinase CheA